MKYIKQNKHGVRYYNVKVLGKERVYAEADIFFELNSIILDYPTYEETPEDIERMAETKADSKIILN